MESTELQYEIVDLPIAYMIKIAGSNLDVIDKYFPTRKAAKEFLVNFKAELSNMPIRHIPQRVKRTSAHTDR